MIPFSIHAPELYTNRGLFQVYQSPNDQTESTARRCAQFFKGYHPVIIDCGDTTSTKGSFTSTYRRQLEIADVPYSITNLKSSDANFAKAFVKDQPNLVILNTARSRELLAAFGRLGDIKINNPGIQISMFGYTEWMIPHRLRPCAVLPARPAQVRYDLRRCSRPFRLSAPADAAEV